MPPRQTAASSHHSSALRHCLPAPHRDRLRLTPVAASIAVLALAASLGSGDAQAQSRPFGSGWMAAKGAVQGHIASTGTLPNGMLAGVNSAARQQQQSRQQLNRSVANLGSAAAAIAAQQAAQAAARANAPVDQPVPDGYTSGGLWDKDAHGNQLTWTGANRPEAGNANGKSTVNIKQTADKAILNWDTFNVGKNTTLNFDQSAGSPNSDPSKSSDWAVLNKVVGADTAPSQIQGAITAQGTVMIVNQNGIVFSGGSQVNVRNLVAAAAKIEDGQFTTGGLYVNPNGTQPTFTDALDAIEVKAGAQITTRASTSATQGGGYALLLGTEVRNAGQITTGNGQTVLAAGDQFYIRKGVGTDGNKKSTTRGNEVSAQLDAGSTTTGKVVNTGLITATTGDITLTGHDVAQAGVAVATTSVGVRGTIHLSNRASDATGRITLGEDSATAIVLDESAATALDSQRDAALKGMDGLANPLAAGNFDNLGKVADDRSDLSRIEIVSGNTVEFQGKGQDQGGSLTLATGGQISVAAKNRTLVDTGAELDVSGAIGVKVSMESNNLNINVQGNEQRDAPINRDSKSLNNADVWVDRRTLVYVPAGTNGYATDRWYTGGGLLEVGGYLATSGHTAGEWMAQGGAVTVTGGDLVTRAGSNVNLSGGTLDVQDGFINQTWLRGADNRLYELSRAPGDLLYKEVYAGFVDKHDRWGDTATRTFYNPLIAPRRRFESGYTVGRDAGKLIVSTNSAVLEGDITSEVYQGDRQTEAAQADLDGYYQSQSAVARRAQLIVGQYLPRYDEKSGRVQYGLDAMAKHVDLVEIQDAIADGLTLDAPVDVSRQGAVALYTHWLNGLELGGLRIAAQENIAVDGDLQVGKGGEIVLYGPQVAVNADISAHGGSIALGNVLYQMSNSNLRIEDNSLPVPTGVTAGVSLKEGATLDVSGLWSNLLLDPEDHSGLAYRDGGAVSVRSTGNVQMEAGSLIDVSSGAAVTASGARQGGRGGDLTLGVSSPAGDLAIDGDLRAYGVNGGGTLTMYADQVMISDAPAPELPGALVLDGGFFNKGFGNYDVTGKTSLAVAEGTQVDVAMPVYRYAEQASATASGAEPAAALAPWTPPLYQQDPVAGALAQRAGASLSLQGGTANSLASELDSVNLKVGQGAVIHVDPGQSIALRSAGQLTVDGMLQAQGGDISLMTLDLGPIQADLALAAAHNRSIWIGEHARLDAAGQAVGALDARGQRYGLVRDGGRIVVGGEISDVRGSATASNNFIVVRPGAVLDVSGAQTTLDVAGLGAIDVASNGGGISLSSFNGLYLDGTMLAQAGGAGAAGGTLNVALQSPEVRIANPQPASPVADPRVRVQRDLVLADTQGDSVLGGGLQPAAADAALVYGYGRLGADTVQGGGFDNLSILSGGLLSFDGDVNLHVNQNLNLYSNVFSLANTARPDTRVALDAAYVRLAGTTYDTTSTDPSKSRVTIPSGVASVLLPDAQLRLVANLIDIRDTVSVRSFGLTTLDSTGDLRFLQGMSPNAQLVGNAVSTSFSSPGSVTLRAAQVYPATGVVASISAGALGPLSFDPDQVLRIESSGGPVPAMPYSAFGELRLTAANIEQAGVLRAPLGSLNMGVEISKVTLLPGSVTSVSGRGLLMPYGGTVDGLDYMYDGKKVALIGAGGSKGQLLQVGVTLGGASVDVQAGAVLDLSGGGELTGTGFISGRGGSTDARYNPLVRNAADGSFSLPGLSTNPVYAIVPGFQAGYAPSGGERGAVDPMVGQQITLKQGVPGLPAGTYTLMPSTYALLPGAFRVELNGQAGLGTAFANSKMRNGSWVAPAQLSIAHTGLGDSLFRQAILTSADVLRAYSQYNETSYKQFVLADAARQGVPRAMLPDDARTLMLNPTLGAGADAFNFDGIGRFDAVGNGYGGAVVAFSGSSSIPGTDNMEVVAAGAQATAGFLGVTLDAGELNALGASRIVVGGSQYVTYGQQGNLVNLYSRAGSLILRQGAVLAAPEVFLISSVRTSSTGSSQISGDLIIERGAGINTLGQGRAAYDSNDGFVYATPFGHMVAVSNGVLSMLPVPAFIATADDRSLQIGTCAVASCAGDTELYSEGTIALSTPSRFVLDDAVRYGTRNLTLAVQGLNVGEIVALADAAAHNVLPQGLLLNQNVLDRLLRGDTQHGAPALETLMLSASGGVNFFGSVTLDTINPETGKSTLDTLVLGTPTIYGYGAAGDVATIRTGTLVWKGAEQTPEAVAAGGPGTGSGALQIEAERIEFGYGPGSQPTGMTRDARLALGFAEVNLIASDRITSSQKGSLSVYQTQGAYETGKGYQYSGGNLNMVAPLVTGEAGSVNSITAGGTLRLTAPADGPVTPGLADAALGAELSLAGRDIIVDTTLALPSGKLTLSAEDDMTLTERAVLDLAGRKIDFNDVSKYSWGGDVVLESRSGNIRQAAGSVIDLSAQFNRAGSLRALALADGAGVLDLQGRILGSSSGQYDAGGTLVPYLAGSVEIRAQHLGQTDTLDTQFAALNQRLNDGGVFGARSFQIKRGDLTIADGLKANEINVSVDNGSLTVVGAIDASGAQVGSIRLAAKNNLTIAGSALLDAHGTVLRVDGYGKIIDSPNRAIVDLTARTGQLTLAAGTRIDLRHGTDAKPGTGAGQNDGLARGTLELNAPRIGSDGLPLHAVPNGQSDAEIHGDIAIDARGALDIRGARSIAVNGMQSYDDATYGTDPAASGRPYQVIDQAYLDIKHAQNMKFIDAALANGGLINGKLAGLNKATYADVLHLRPSLDIVSKTADGDLVVQGDLDLSGYRYASLNPYTQLTGVYGSGESGALAIRAGGNLDIYGSITDGFAPPPVTQDDNGWLLLPGLNLNGSDTVLPHGGVTLADGTIFEGGATLNYDLPIKAMTFDGGMVMPAQSQLAAPLALVAGTVFSADVRDTAGNLLHAAGSVLAADETLPAGTRLGAGMRLPTAASLSAMTWPKGVPLPQVVNTDAGAIKSYVLNGDYALPQGAFIPASANIKLPAGVDSYDLRPSVNSRQGAMWALAQMLPEGSQSWSLRLAAGADLDAADNRIVQARPAYGDLRLADSHYGMFSQAQPGGSDFIWTADALIELDPSLVPGMPIDADYVLNVVGYTSVDQMCAEIANWCAPSSGFVWNQTGADQLASEGIPGIVVGSAVTDEFLAGFGLTVKDLCGSTDFCDVSAGTPYEPTPGSTRFSVVRTGAADLELLSGGNLRMDTLYGVYTAGTSSLATRAGDPYNLPRAVGVPQADGTPGTVLNDPNGAYEKFVDGGAESLARAWYPSGGGNLTIKVGGDMTGDLMQSSTGSSLRPDPLDPGYDSAELGNWLWRQGSGGALGAGNEQPTAWWINFGSYVAPTLGAGADKLLGFTGYGTLGGGDLRVDVAGDAGILERKGTFLNFGTANQHSEGLVLAVGGTGRVLADGSLSLTGGGDLDVRIGGALNPFRLNPAEQVATSAVLKGAVINLRGSVLLQAGSIGNQTVQFGTANEGDPRAADPFIATRAAVQEGIVLAPGDASFGIFTRGDLIMSGVNDPGRVTQMNATPFIVDEVVHRGDSWFSLWTDHTAINLFSAGGDLTPIHGGNGLATSDDAYVYPSILSAVAASGSLHYGTAAAFRASGAQASLLLAPGANGKLEFLAADSIYGGGLAVSPSGAAADTMATPFHPAYSEVTNFSGLPAISNVSRAGNSTGVHPLFAFGANSVSAEAGGAGEPARFYAVNGDLVGVRSGEIVAFLATDGGQRAGQTWYEGGQPVWMMAGRDIVASGTPLQEEIKVNNGLSSGSSYLSSGNLFVHNDPTDVSIVSAGRDIIYSSFNVAGPGTLEVTAGRNIQMDDRAGIASLGAVVPGDSRPGASIAVLAGVGAQGPDYAAFLQRYLDPANRAQAGVPLADQDGKVVKTYEAELAAWLADEANGYGFAGTTDEAQAFFAALPAEQQRIFARQVYFAELKAGGREFNDPGSTRFGSYLRGRDAIAMLFPEADAAGKPMDYSGDITMFRGSKLLVDPISSAFNRTIVRSGYVQTLFGGDIQVLTPGGRQVYGVEGEAAPANAGVLTQGAGDIQMYSLGSILLGQSRIMTTFGGNILAWSAQGDINAGRGSKTTVVYTPPRRVYDQWGNVTLSSDVPSTGAGIATLAPIPEVPAGDVDLVAPEGTVDIGEAGVRSSGAVNIAALHVVNAANIQAVGETIGVPVLASVNVSALTSASAASSSAATAAQDTVQRSRAEARKNQPSIFSVQILGFGSETASGGGGSGSNNNERSVSYRPDSAVQVVGDASMDAAARNRLTREERQMLGL